MIREEGFEFVLLHLSISRNHEVSVRRDDLFLLVLGQAGLLANLSRNGKVKFGNYAFLLEKVTTVDFSETIAACDMKVGRCRQPIGFMKVCEY